MNPTPQWLKHTPYNNSTAIKLFGKDVPDSTKLPVASLVDLVNVKHLKNFQEYFSLNLSENQSTLTITLTHQSLKDKREIVMAKNLPPINSEYRLFFTFTEKIEKALIELLGQLIEEEFWEDF